MLERDQWRMVAALVTVAVVATALLAVADRMTRAPIAQAQRKALHQALAQVLPPHANDPQRDMVTMTRAGKPMRLYPARADDGRLLALAWEEVAPDGYSGPIRVLMSVDPTGVVQAVRVTEHRETPGLGDGIVRNRAWIDAFAGKTLDNARWAVKKDGGDFDQFTGATITPRAVVKAIHEGLMFFAKHRAQILRKLQTVKGLEDE